MGISMHAICKNIILHEVKFNQDEVKFNQTLKNSEKLIKKGVFFSFLKFESNIS